MCDDDHREVFFPFFLLGIYFPTGRTSLRVESVEMTKWDLITFCRVKEYMLGKAPELRHEGRISHQRNQIKLFLDQFAAGAYSAVHYTYPLRIEKVQKAQFMSQ